MALGERWVYSVIPLDGTQAAHISTDKDVHIATHTQTPEFKLCVEPQYRYTPSSHRYGTGTKLMLNVSFTDDCGVHSPPHVKVRVPIGI